MSTSNLPHSQSHCAAFVDAPMKRDGANRENADEHDCARRKTRTPRQLGVEREREREAGHTETMIHKCKHHVDIAVITNNKRDESGTCKLWQVTLRGKKKPTSLAAAMPATEAGKREEEGGGG